MTGAVIVLSLNTHNLKIVSPYGCWRYEPAPETSATKEPPYEMLKNLRVGEETYDLLTTIKDAVNTHSSERDDVYFYPHMPFFYIMHDKLPPTRNPVQWFDVIPDREMQKRVRHSGPIHQSSWSFSTAPISLSRSSGDEKAVLPDTVHRHIE